MRPPRRPPAPREGLPTGQTIVHHRRRRSRAAAGPARGHNPNAGRSCPQISQMGADSDSSHEPRSESEAGLYQAVKLWELLPQEVPNDLWQMYIHIPGHGWWHAVIVSDTFGGMRYLLALHLTDSYCTAQVIGAIDQAKAEASRLHSRLDGPPFNRHRPFRGRIELHVPMLRPARGRRHHARPHRLPRAHSTGRARTLPPDPQTRRGCIDMYFPIV